MSEVKKQLVDAFIESVRLMNRKAGYSDKGIHELRSLIDTAIQETIDSATAELRRELEEVRKDKERLDWLGKKGNEGWNLAWKLWNGTFRNAIDAAINQREK